MDVDRTQQPDTPSVARDVPDRRRGPDQRRYNRRSPVSDVPPPYYETFERIAAALERIERLLADRGPLADDRDETSSERPVVPPARDARLR